MPGPRGRRRSPSRVDELLTLSALTISAERWTGVTRDAVVVGDLVGIACQPIDRGLDVGAGAEPHEEHVGPVLIGGSPHDARGSDRVPRCCGRSPGTSLVTTMPPTPSDVWSPCTMPIVGNVAEPTTRSRARRRCARCRRCRRASCPSVAVPSTISPARSTMRPSTVSAGSPRSTGPCPTAGCSTR